MASDYPVDLDAFPTTRPGGNLVGPDVLDHADAINKIELELGLSPSSSYADVAARLAAIDAAVAAAGGGGASASDYFQLASGTAAGATTAQLNRAASDIAIGQNIAIGVGTSKCEIRRVTAVVSSTVTLASALKYAHSSGESARAAGFWVPVTWWGIQPSSSVDSFRQLSNMFLDRSIGGFGILGLGEGNLIYSSRPLWAPDKTWIQQLGLVAKTPFGLDATLGVWTYDGRPHQHFFNAAGQQGTVVSVDAVANTVTLSSSIGTAEGETVAFYTREGLGTIPGGLEEGRTYYLKTQSGGGTVVTLSIDKWGSSTVDITDAGSGEIVWFSHGNTRLNTYRLFLDGGNIRGLNGFRGTLQQQSSQIDLRCQNFGGVGCSIDGQQSEFYNPEVIDCAIGVRMAGGQFVYLYGGNYEQNDINFEMLDMSFQSPSTQPAFAANRNIAIVAAHFESPGLGTKLVQTITITGTPTAGTFTLTYNGQTTTPLNWNATAAQVQSALEALSTIGTGNVVCTGGPLPSGQIKITLQGTFASGFASAITAANTITGGSYAVSTVSQGASQISLKGGGISVSDCVDSGGTDPVSGLGVTFLKVEGAAAANVQNGGYKLQEIGSIGNTGLFVDDAIRGVQIGRQDGDAGSASTQLSYLIGPSRHGGSIGRHFWLAGDGGRQAIFGAAGAPLWDLVGAAAQAHSLIRLKPGATQTGNSLEAYDKSGVLKVQIDPNGQLLVNGAVVSGGGGGAGYPAKYKTGFYYIAPSSSRDSTADGAVTPTLNRLFFVPFAVGEALAADRIAASVTTAVASAVVRLGIYSDTDGLPNALVLDAGTVDASTTGYKEIVISQALSAGTLYWIALCLQGVTGVALRGVNVGCGAEWVASSSLAGDSRASNYIQDGVTGALPATATPVNGTTQSPFIKLRAA